MKRSTLLWLAGTLAYVAVAAYVVVEAALVEMATLGL